MTFLDRPLTINKFSRPGKRRNNTKGLVIHWVENPGQPAQEVWQFFENRKNGKTGYGSAQYIIGLDGGIIRTMPDGEVAYHCGATNKDPQSGQYYTELARYKFPTFTIDFEQCSPNQILTGIELCHTDVAGNFTKDTLISAVDLCAALCSMYRLDPTADIYRHYDIVGYKRCPKLFCDNEQLWMGFLCEVTNKINRSAI